GNNVLRAIQAFGEVLHGKLHEDPVLARPISQILQAVKRGHQITQQILRFSNPAEPRLEAMDASSWTRDFSEEARTILRDSHLELQVGENLPVRGSAHTY